MDEQGRRCGRSGTPSPEEDYMAAGRGIVFPDDNPAPEYLASHITFAFLTEEANVHVKGTYFFDMKTITSLL